MTDFGLEDLIRAFNIGAEDWDRPTHGMGEPVANRDGLFRITPKSLTSYDGTFEMECVDSRKACDSDEFKVRCHGDVEPGEYGADCIEVSLWYPEVVELVAYAQQWLDTHDPDTPQVALREVGDGNAEV